MIYEYRIYEAMPGKMPDLNARFRNHTVKLFEKHGLKNVGYWTPNVGEYSNRLLYMLAFQSVQQREQAYASFSADPEWQKARADSEVKGPLVARVFNTLLTPTDYSPLK